MKATTLLLRQSLYLLSVPIIITMVSCGHSTPHLLLLADIQYCDCPTAGTRHYSESLAKLDTIAERVKGEKLRGVVLLGDVIDHDFESFNPVQVRLKKFEAPIYWVLGNHDFSVADSLKQRVVEFTGAEKGYYSRLFKGTRMLFLNGLYHSTIAWMNGDQEYEKASVTLAKLASRGVANAYNWNGGLGEEQLTWIQEELNTAKKKKQKVLMFCHQPAVPGEAHSLWDTEELIKVVEFYGEPVTYYCGHNHAGGHYQIGNLEIVNLQGLVEGDEVSYLII